MVHIKIYFSDASTRTISIYRRSTKPGLGNRRITQPPEIPLWVTCMYWVSRGFYGELSLHQWKSLNVRDSHHNSDCLTCRCSRWQGYHTVTWFARRLITPSSFLLSSTSVISETQMRIIFREGAAARRGLPIGEVGRFWEESNPWPSSWDATTLIGWPPPAKNSTSIWLAW